MSLFVLVAGSHPAFHRPLNLEEWREYYGEQWNSMRYHYISSPEPETDTEPWPESEGGVGGEAGPESEGGMGGEAGPEREGSVGGEAASDSEGGEAGPESEGNMGGEAESESENSIDGESRLERRSRTNKVEEAQGEAETTADLENTESEWNMTPGADNESKWDSEPEDEFERDGKSEPEGQSHEEREPLSLPENAYSRFTWLEIIDYVCTALFTIDLFVRYIFCPKRITLLWSFLHWVDVFSLTVTFLTYTLEEIYVKEKYEASFLDILHCLQIARVFRLFRLVQNFVGFRVLFYAFKASVSEMLLMLMFLAVAMLIFSTFVYFSGDENFSNIPDSFWWAIVTMTTVGYGDIVPGTALSKTVGAVCAISGVCLIAVVVPVFVNNFMLFYSYSKVWGNQNEQCKNEKSEISNSTTFCEKKPNSFRSGSGK